MNCRLDRFVANQKPKRSRPQQTVLTPLQSAQESPTLQGVSAVPILPKTDNPARTQAPAMRDRGLPRRPHRRTPGGTPRRTSGGAPRVRPMVLGGVRLMVLHDVRPGSVGDRIPGRPPVRWLSRRRGDNAASRRPSCPPRSNAAAEPDRSYVVQYASRRPTRHPRTPLRWRGDDGRDHARSGAPAKPARKPALTPITGRRIAHTATRACARPHPGRSPASARSARGRPSRRQRRRSDCYSARPAIPLFLKQPRPPGIVDRGFTEGRCDGFPCE
ncbi:hypothetical protein JOF29_003609 [Kribbella aluminosa]|uniref:Uncharacterized protein n=1 Tax=Kribbella aluminosa TaxID=416017 RepID=A0ABS4ULS6_9ACTN|nr:hypothetical protein [Kribbella aluminosa]